MKPGTIFFRGGERWFHKGQGDEVRMKDLAPHLELRWMMEHLKAIREAEMGWRASWRGLDGARD